MIARLLLLALATFVASPASAADKPKAVELNQLRLYVPIPDIEARFGDDVKPLAEYIKALEKKVGELVAKEPRPKAKGLLIAVGIKSKKDARVWCEAVDGDVPDELIQTLEKELAKIEAVDLAKAPAGFAMEVKLYGQKPDKFPEFPKSWIEAAKAGKQTKLVPPDELFKTIWPDKK